MNRLGTAIPGYLAAVFVAALAATFLFVIILTIGWLTDSSRVLNSDLSLPEVGSAIAHYMTSSFMIFLSVFVLVFLFSWPGYIAALCFASIFQWQNRWVFALAGMMNAIFSVGLKSILFTELSIETGELLFALPAGFAGGWAYWRFAGWLDDVDPPTALQQIAPPQ